MMTEWLYLCAVTLAIPALFLVATGLIYVFGNDEIKQQIRDEF